MRGLIIIMFGLISFDLLAQQKDPYKTEIINGKKFIIHKVEEKETLYGISRKYGVSIYTILEFNPTADSGLEIGQIIKVPYTEPVINRVDGNMATTKTVHVVKEKETLFAISRLYEVRPEEIRLWNNLADNTISPGQELIIQKTSGANIGASTQVIVMPHDTRGRKLHQVSQGETMYSISKQYGVNVQQIKEWNNMPDYNISNGQVLIVSDVPGETGFAESKEPTEKALVKEIIKPEDSAITEPRTIIISEDVKAINEVKERGQAELIDGKDANRKHLAMHRVAPVGTLIKVRNEMNNREVWVKVVGKLPDTGENNKVLIKISRSAYQQLGAIDNRFLVELTYYK